MESQTSSLFQ
jgi:hypothetical protein